MKLCIPKVICSNYNIESSYVGLFIILIILRSPTVKTDYYRWNGNLARLITYYENLYIDRLLYLFKWHECIQ